jgi:hypothetical protein
LLIAKASGLRISAGSKAIGRVKNPIRLTRHPQQFIVSIVVVARVSKLHVEIELGIAQSARSSFINDDSADKVGVLVIRERLSGAQAPRPKGMPNDHVIGMPAAKLVSTMMGMAELKFEAASREADTMSSVSPGRRPPENTRANLLCLRYGDRSRVEG